MYSICYVLVDSEKLEYYKEMIISICSLRRNDFAGEILVLMDSKTAKYIESLAINRLEQFSVKTMIVDIPEAISQKEKSRYIKTQLRELIEGTFLFIDTDTIIADKLSEEPSEFDIAMVLDVHCKFCDMSQSVKQYHIERNDKCGYKLLDNQEYFNSGVMWVKDTEATHKLFSVWHKNWLEYSKSGMCEDQPGLNHANRELGEIIKRLPDVYNVQVSGNPFPINHLVDGLIIHYTHKLDSQYLLVNKSIRTLDITDSIIERILDNPRKAFAENVVLKPYDEHEKLKNTNQYFVLYRLYLKHKKLFKIGEFNASILVSIKSKMNKVIRRKK